MPSSQPPPPLLAPPDSANSTSSSILDISMQNVSTAEKNGRNAQKRLSAHGPIGGEEKELLDRAKGLGVTQAERQEGYDVSLLALQPRNTTAPPPTHPSPATKPSRSTPSSSRPTSSSYTDPTRPISQHSYPADIDDSSHLITESTPLTPAFPLSITIPTSSSSTGSLAKAAAAYPSRPHYFNPHQGGSGRGGGGGGGGGGGSFVSIPSISSPNPHSARNAYAARAMASSSQSHSKLGMGKVVSGGSYEFYSDGEEGEGEKGSSSFLPTVGFPRGGRGGKNAGQKKRTLWQRKWLLTSLAILALVVCAGVGIGVGLGVSHVGGGSSEDKESTANPAAESAASSSSSSSATISTTQPTTLVAGTVTAAAVQPTQQYQPNPTNDEGGQAYGTGGGVEGGVAPTAGSGESEGDGGWDNDGSGGASGVWGRVRRRRVTLL